MLTEADPPSAQVFAVLGLIPAGDGAERSFLTLNLFIKSDRGLWSLWAEGRAVDNGFVVIHGKRPGSPALFAGELSTNPQTP